MASALANVEVDFNVMESPSRPDTVQNDGTLGRERKYGRDSSDLADILIGILVLHTSLYYIQIDNRLFQKQESH